MRRIPLNDTALGESATGAWPGMTRSGAAMAADDQREAFGSG